MTEHPSILIALDWFDPRIYKGIYQFGNEHNWHISPYLYSDRVIPYGWPGDGAICCFGKTLGKFIASLNMPKVDISVWDFGQSIPKVVVDNDKIGQLAAQHFLERGFHQFAYYSWSLVEVNRTRQVAFFEALKKVGVPQANLHVINQPPAKHLSDWAMHQKMILDQLRDLPRPIAVFTGQDNLGASLIEICNRNGIHVPEEIAVLGVDNIEPLCECLAVPLSSIDAQLELLGYTAARQLHRLMNGEIRVTDPQLTIEPLGVVSRQSTDILAIDHPCVVKAVQFIKSRFQEPIILDDIAASAGLSKRGLEKAFLKHLGRTPAAELRRIRLDTAKKLLTESDEKIQTIAVETGYSNSSNLSFAFNRDTGMSPKAYRRKYRPKSRGLDSESNSDSV